MIYTCAISGIQVAIEDDNEFVAPEAAADYLKRAGDEVLRIYNALPSAADVIPGDSDE